MRYFITLLCFVCFGTLFSQVVNIKYGKVTTDELTMTTYKPDSLAVAVVIYENGYFAYETIKKNFQTTLEVSRKVKILKRAGVDLAQVTIPYYYVNSLNGGSAELIEAIAYNLEGGKIVASRCNLKQVKDEKVNAQTRQLRFTIPNVQPGSIIEYKYKVISNQTSVIPDWKMQGNLPVMNSQFEALIPEYYQVEVEKKGFEKINSEEFVQLQAFTTEAGKLNSKSKLMKFSAKNLPALKSIPFLSYSGDYCTKVRITVKGVEMPNAYYEPHYQDWGTLERTLMMDSVFGNNLRMANPFKVEARAVTGYVSTEREKLFYIFNFIKNRIKWNGVYDFWGVNPRAAARNCSGNNAQINMLLMSALKDIGFKSYPVFIGARSQGRLPDRNPRVDDITTFIVCAELSTKERVYMDASGTGINMLPMELLVDKAYLMSPTPVRNKWVDLTKAAINQQVINVDASLDANGLLTGTVSVKYTNQFFADNKNVSAGNFQNKYNVGVKNYTIDVDYANSAITEKMNFSKKMDSGSQLYMNPLLFIPMEQNPVEGMYERELPLEFNYPYIQTVITTIRLPQNYELMKLPQPVIYQLKDRGAIMTYEVIQENINNNMVLKVKYHFKLNKTKYEGDEADTVSEFFGKVVQKNVEQIILRKR